MNYKVGVIKRVAFLLMTMALAVAMVACQAAVTTKKTPVALGGKALAPMSFPDFVAGTATASSKRVTITSSHFKGTDLKYTADSANPSAATATASGNVVTVTPKGAGTTDVLVTATATADDEEGTASLSFTVTVNAPTTTAPQDNNAPRLKAGKTLPHLTGLKYGGSESVELSDYFTDDEGDNITYTAESTNTEVVTISVSGSMLTITVVNHGDATIRVTATDTHNQSRRETFDVIVINQAPMKTDENTHFGPYSIGHEQRLDLSDFFTDVEGDLLTYTTDSDGDRIATVTDPGTGSMITIVAVGAGTTTIDIIANDGANDSEPNMFTVTVSAVPNEKPTVKMEIMDMTLNLMVNDMMESATEKINLADHFEDPDGKPLPLKYSADSEMAMIEGSMLTIRADASDADSMTTITVTATDGAASVPETFTVTVTDPAVPTTTSELPDQAFDHDDMAARPFTLSGYFSMATNYDAVPDDESVVGATEADGVLTLTPVSAGRTVVTITPSNSGGDGSRQTITVIVESMPVPTHIKALQSMTFSSDDAPDPITLSDYFSGATDYGDPASNDESVVGATEADGVLTLTPVSHGTALVTVTPSNSGGTGAAQSFNVTVQAKPRLKTDKSLDDMRLVARMPSKLDLSTYFEDLDGSIAKYSTVTSDAKMVAVYVTTTVAPKTNLDKALMAVGATVTLHARDIISGTATITVTVTDDSELTLTRTFVVAVVSANKDPEIMGENPLHLDRFKLGDDPKKVIDDAKIRLHFKDDDLNITDDDLLTFSVKYVAKKDNLESDDLDPADRVATATIEPTKWNGDGAEKFTVTVTPEKEGPAHDILIVATDLVNEKAVYKRIPVQVNRRPLAEGAQKLKPLKLSEYTDAVGLSSGVDPIKIPLVTAGGGYFHDDDGDTLTCTAVPDVTGSTAPAVVQMKTNNQLLTLIVAEKYSTTLVPMTVKVSCMDVWKDKDDKEEVKGELSPTQSFTVSVTQVGKDGSVQ